MRSRLVLALALANAAALKATATPAVLHAADYAHHIQRFNTMTPETVVNLVPNAAAWDWMREQIPLFACPNRDIEEIYYFRWWSLRTHLIRTPTGFAFTEFLQRQDPISSAVGHHVMEARWLHDPRFVDDYARYWLRGGPDGALHPKLHNYSEWLPHALYSRYLVTHDAAFVAALLPDLIRDFTAWNDHLTSSGLYWQFDVRDAMEESISGSRRDQNLRPPLNCYQYGNATAIAAIARLAGKLDVANEYDAKAATLRRLVQEKLWNPAAQFFEVRWEPADTFSDAREEIGFIPWYFNLPAAGRGYEAAWRQFADDRGFRAPFGITTAERRHPKFRSHGVGKCEWDGAVWPYATSQTLTALANARRDYPDVPVTRRDWLEAFLTYTRSQYDASGQTYIGEYLDETTGRWIDRGTRSRDYNHSTYADLLIAGLVGLCPRADDTIDVNPLLPAETWDWFCVDDIYYHGHALTILWDRDGKKFNRGAGLTVFVNGTRIAHSASLERVTGPLRP